MAPANGEKRDGLPGIQDAGDRQALEGHDIVNLDAVWDRVGRDMGIRDLVHATGVDRARLIRDLAAVARRKEEEKGTSWPLRHALDLVLIAALIVLAVLVARAVPLSRSVGIALRDLRPGDVLSAGVLHRPADLDPPRRLKRDVAEGGYVLLEWLEAVPPLDAAQLRGRYRLSLRIRPEQARLLPSLPARVPLAASAPGKEGEEPRVVLLADVPVLSSAQSAQDVSLVAALTEGELRQLLPLLPGAEVYVLQRLR